MLSSWPLRRRSGIGTIRFLDGCAFVGLGPRLLDRRLRLVRLNMHGGLRGGVRGWCGPRRPATPNLGSGSFDSFVRSFLLGLVMTADGKTAYVTDQINQLVLDRPAARQRRGLEANFFDTWKPANLGLELTMLGQDKQPQCSEPCLERG